MPTRFCCCLTRTRPVLRPPSARWRSFCRPACRWLSSLSAPAKTRIRSLPPTALTKCGPAWRRPSRCSITSLMSLCSGMAKGPRARPGRSSSSSRSSGCSRAILNAISTSRPWQNGPDLMRRCCCARQPDQPVRAGSRNRSGELRLSRQKRR